MRQDAALPYLALEELDLRGKTLILRVDFNSPIDQTQGISTLKSTKRIDDHIQNTIRALFDSEHPPRNIVLLTHQGRSGQADFTTLRAHFEHCRKELQPEQIKVFYAWEELTDSEVAGLHEEAVASPDVLQRIQRLRERTVLLLENVRFSEAEDDAKASGGADDFAHSPLIKMLGAVEQRIVALDGFSVAHRAQASVVGLANLGPVYAGPVVLREIRQLSAALENPERPMVLIVGGGKSDDSLASIDHFLSNGMANIVLTGGLVALIFLLARGQTFDKVTMQNISRSTRDLKRAIAHAHEIVKRKGSHVKVPVDLAIGPDQGLAGQRITLPVGDVDAKCTHPVGDIGIETIAGYVSELAKAKTIVMNGPMGRYEWALFARGTEEVLRYVSLVAHDRNAHALIGGGDTGAALGQLQRDYAQTVKECSSGKAFLEVLASGTVESLPGVRILARRAVASSGIRRPSRTARERLTAKSTGANERGR